MTVEIPIIMASRIGSRATIAFGRTADAELVCHLEDGYEDADAWVITHRRTGCAVRPCRTTSKEAALALIDVYTPIADWASIPTPQTPGSPPFGEATEKWQTVRRQIELAYEQFEWPPRAGAA